MNQLNLFDILVLTFATFSVLSACWRGLGREVLHSLLFGGLLVASYFYIAAQEPPADAQAAARMLVNYGYITITFYLLTWVVMRFLGPIFISSDVVPLRGRFWAGSLSLAKIVAAGLLLNFWYALNTPDAHPQRLDLLPDILRSSTVIQLSDKTTDDMHRWMAARGWITYQKYLERPLTPEEMQSLETQELMGIR